MSGVEGNRALRAGGSVESVSRAERAVEGREEAIEARTVRVGSEAGDVVSLLFLLLLSSSSSTVLVVGREDESSPRARARI